MQESGIPVTYGYISDTHDKKTGATGCTSPGNALGAGDACYVAALHSYDQAFETFFQRLAADGITPANTEFVISAEENDQMAAANVGRVTQPTPAGCDGVTVACHYATGQIGELQANIKGLLSTTASSGTQFDVEPQGAAIYVHGQPAADDPTVRQLERDTAAMTSNLTYSGVPNEHIVKYQAGALEQRVLHMQTNDPLRTPTYTLFPMPDYFFSTSGANVSINPGFAWDHGYYSPNIDITWAGIVGSGCRGARRGRAGAGGRQRVARPELDAHGARRRAPSARGSRRPTCGRRCCYLTGLQRRLPDRRPGDHARRSRRRPRRCRGRPGWPPCTSRSTRSVGEFGTDTLIADSAALASGSATGDTQYLDEQETLQHLAKARDQLAAEIKVTLARSGGRCDAVAWHVDVGAGSGAGVVASGSQAGSWFLSPSAPNGLQPNFGRRHSSAASHTMRGGRHPGAGASPVWPDHVRVGDASVRLGARPD